MVWKLLFNKVFLLLIILLLLVGFGYYVYQQTFSSPSLEFRMHSQTVIKQMRSLHRLETASFSIEKVIDAGTSGNAFQQFLYGDRILLIAHGQVIAGIDMNKLTEKDMRISGKEISLTLPAPEILVVTLDNNQTRVFDRKQGLLTKGNKDLESKARTVASEAIKDAACKGNILSQASENGKKQLSAFLKALGFDKVTIEIPLGSC